MKTENIFPDIVQINVSDLQENFAQVLKFLLANNVWITLIIVVWSFSSFPNFILKDKALTFLAFYVRKAHLARSVAYRYTKDTLFFHTSTVSKFFIIIREIMLDSLMNYIQLSNPLIGGHIAAVT